MRSAGMNGETKGCKSCSPHVVIGLRPLACQLSNAISQDEASEACEALSQNWIGGQGPIVAAPKPSSCAAYSARHTSQGSGIIHSATMQACSKKSLLGIIILPQSGVLLPTLHKIDAPFELRKSQSSASFRQYTCHLLGQV